MMVVAMVVVNVEMRGKCRASSGGLSQDAQGADHLILLLPSRMHHLQDQTAKMRRVQTDLSPM